MHPLLYPMYVIKLSDLLEMKGVPEDFHSLLRRGHLHQWQSGMFVIFVSHEWLSSLHPDPKGSKLEVLQQCFLKLLKGSMSFSLREEVSHEPLRDLQDSAKICEILAEAYVWMDWCSIPRDDASENMKAVQSLPGYVERSEGFVALAPELEGKNFKSWLSRGWCQAELLFHLLAEKTETLVVHSPVRVEVRLGLQWQLESLGHGQFSMEEDKAEVEKLVGRTE